MINDKVAEIFEEASILLRRKSKIVWLKSSAIFFFLRILQIWEPNKLVTLT